MVAWKSGSRIFSNGIIGPRWLILPVVCKFCRGTRKMYNNAFPNNIPESPKCARTTAAINPGLKYPKSAPNSNPPGKHKRPFPRKTFLGIPIPKRYFLHRGFSSKCIPSSGKHDIKGMIQFPTRTNLSGFPNP